MSEILSQFEKIVNHEQPSIEYLKQIEIQSTIEKGLADLVLSNPKNPISYLGNWLINYSKNQKDIVKESARSEQKQELISKHWARQAEQEAVEIEATTYRQSQTARRNQIINELEESNDLEDNLQQLVEYIHNTFSLTGIYIAILEKSKRPVTELDDDLAHLDEEAPEVLRYIVTSQCHSFMLDKELTEEQAPLSHGIWKSQEEDEEEEWSLKPKFVEDVIWEQKMYFFKVPRLGCYYVVPLSIKSRLFEAALDVQIQNLKLEEGQEPQDEAVTDLKLIVGMDTLGQDRILKQEELDQITELLQKFQQEWERAEKQALDKDISITKIELEAIAEKSVEINQFTEREKNAGDDAVKTADPGTSDDEKELRRLQALVDVWRQRILENWEGLYSFRDRRVIKYPRVWLTAFYYFGVKQNYIVEKNTTKLDWKKANKFLNSGFKTYIEGLYARGSKPLQIPNYAERRRLLALIESTPEEDIKSYSVHLYMLRQFLLNSLTLRVMDVQHRRKAYLERKQHRKDMKQKEKERLARKEVELQTVKDANEDLDIEEWLEHWEAMEANHPVEIPAKESPDIDGDVIWEDE